jgi:hypothetical protein
MIWSSSEVAELGAPFRKFRTVAVGRAKSTNQPAPHGLQAALCSLWLLFSRSAASPSPWRAALVRGYFRGILSG